MAGMTARDIVDLYDRLHATGVSRRDKLELARRFVVDPASLADLFAKSVEALGAYEPKDEGFYTDRIHREVGDVKATSTTDLALRLRDARPVSPVAGDHQPLLLTEGIDAPGVAVVSPEALAFEYLDRELVATRTTGGVSPEGTAVRLDLLLKAADGIPIIGEVKRTSDVDVVQPTKKPATDKDAFSALIQALACASRLATPAQYARLSRYGRAEARGRRDVGADAALAPVAPPTFDVYVVLHNRPTSTHLPELTIAAERLSVLVLAQPPVARYIRRIACLITTLEDETLTAVTEFAYERPAPPTGRVECAFADYFRPWGLHLPDAAVLPLADGRLEGRGWSVRWRWHHDGALEFRAAHRMTNERWHIIDPDGSIHDKPVPPEMMVFSPGDDRSRAEAEYTAGWRAHGEAVKRDGMAFDVAATAPSDTVLAWRLDRGSGRDFLPPR